MYVYIYIWVIDHLILLEKAGMHIPPKNVWTKLEVVSFPINKCSLTWVVSHTWLQMPLLQLRGVAMQLPSDQKQLALAAHSIVALEKSTWTSDGFHEFFGSFELRTMFDFFLKNCFVLWNIWNPGIGFWEFCRTPLLFGVRTGFL